MRLLDYFKRMYRIHLKWKGMKLAWPSICCSLWRRGRCRSGTGSLSSAPSQSTWKNRPNRYFIQKIKVYEAAVFFAQIIHIKWPWTLCVRVPYVPKIPIQNYQNPKTLGYHQHSCKTHTRRTYSYFIKKYPSFPGICPSSLHDGN